MIRRAANRRAVKQTNYFSKAGEEQEGGYPLPTPNLSPNVSYVGKGRLSTFEIAEKILPDLKGAKKMPRKKKRELRNDSDERKVV